MASTWGPEGPPDEAYSRVSRDLAAVTAGFVVYLDDLPRRLTETFECAVREPTDQERARLGGDRAEHAYVVQPDGDDRSPLLVGRFTFEGGTGAVVAGGIAIEEPVPTCFCDACDEDSESLVDQVEELLEVVTGGCREFRRPYRKSFGQRLADGPWLEHGYVRPNGGTSAHASAEVKGEPFDRTWAPWRRRQAS
ncbi:MAG: DUF6226 family protein [Nocardioides sp.]